MNRSFWGVSLVGAGLWAIPVSAQTRTYYNLGLDGFMWGNSFNSSLTFDNDGFSGGIATLQGADFRASAGDVSADWNALSVSRRSFQGVALSVPQGRFEFTGIAGQTFIARSLFEVLNQPSGLLAPRPSVQKSDLYGFRADYRLTRNLSLSGSSIYTPDASDFEGKNILSTALSYTPDRHTRLAFEAAQSKGGSGVQLAAFRQTNRFRFEGTVRNVSAGFSSAGNLELRTNRSGYRVGGTYRIAQPLSLSASRFRFRDGFGGRSNNDFVAVNLSERDLDTPREGPVNIGLQYQKRELLRSELLGGATQRVHGPGIRFGRQVNAWRVQLGYDRLTFTGEESNGTPRNTQFDRFSVLANRSISRQGWLSVYGALNEREDQNFGELNRAGRDIFAGFTHDFAVSRRERGVRLRLGYEFQRSRFDGRSGTSHAGRIGFDLPLGTTGRRFGLDYRRQISSTGVLENTYGNTLYLSFRQPLSIGRRPAALVPLTYDAQRVSELGRVIFRVFEDANLNGVRDAGEVGVPKIVVGLSDNALARTGDDGTVTFSNIPPQEFDVRLVPESLPIEYTFLATGRQRVNLKPRSRLTIDFPVSRTGTLSGRAVLVLPDGQTEPLVGAILRVAGTDVITFSSADGSFLFTNVPPGARTLQIEPQFLRGGNFSVAPLELPASVMLAPSGTADVGEIRFQQAQAPIVLGALPMPQENGEKPAPLAPVSGEIPAPAPIQPISFP